MIVRLLTLLVRSLKQDSSYRFDDALSASDIFGLVWKVASAGLRGLLHRPFLGGTKGLVLVGPRVKLRNRGHIRLGRNFVIEEGAEVQGLSKNGVRFGDNVTVGALSMIRPSGYYGRAIGVGLEVGDRSNIGPYAYIGASGGISIGDDVMMGPRVSMFAENHNFASTETPMREQGVSLGSIVIEDDCWLAANCVILSGVRIGRGSVVAAGSIVNKDVPPYSIVGGNPARVIRSRRPEHPAQENQ